MLTNLWARNSSTKILASQNFGRAILRHKPNMPWVHFFFCSASWSCGPGHQPTTRLSRLISSESLYATASIDQLTQLFPIGKATDPSPDPGRLVVPFQWFTDDGATQIRFRSLPPPACPEVHAAHQWSKVRSLIAISCKVLTCLVPALYCPLFICF
jgi:hypothetical protein